MKKINLILCAIGIIVLGLVSGCSKENTTQNPIVSLESVDVRNVADGVEVSRLEYLSDEHTVVGYMLKPKMDTDASLPVLIFNRGGNQNDGMVTADTLGYLSNWANQGYVVLASQYRGSNGSEGTDEFGGSDVNDILNLLHVAEELEYTDASKVAMLGVSRGGMMAYLSNKNNANIKAIAVIGGITDLFDFYEFRNDGIKPMLNKLVGNPETNEEEFKKRSAIFWAEKLNVPTLILHGENDTKVPVSQARELANRLEEENKEFKFVEYEEGDHLLNTHFEESHKEIFAWFDHHLH
ncbi:S9 family peptidase [Sutcliffiella horikoshii]|uniref:S9 family peptidase n=1 Tax=Sutcliffiella horikoshii TaxID=79883 RepID=A0A5D4SQZ0_9BACI|nr:prolyl oligopeptidase family serine peptidase [Sutcliffiella horikoshii]TYS64552.1 S9 family peptidase [Sutcliffiella horikoshii]